MVDFKKGGVIMDVVNKEQAEIAERAGAVTDMALERVPSDIRKAGGVARMADRTITEEVLTALAIPVIAIGVCGDIAEARVLVASGVAFIDRSEVLTRADDVFPINKSDFNVPFVCGARNIGEAARRIGEGAKMLRTNGEPGTGNVVEAVRHLRQIHAEINQLLAMSAGEVMVFARDNAAPFDVLMYIRYIGRLLVTNYAAGGVATPADAALMMELGADGVFVGSGIFKSNDPEKFAKAIVQATENYQDYKLIGELSKGLGTAMKGLEMS